MASVVDRIPLRSKYLMASFRSPTRHSAAFDISLRDTSAVEYWCRHFHTSPERLLEAVRRVGTNPDIVRLELRAL